MAATSVAGKLAGVSVLVLVLAVIVGRATPLTSSDGQTNMDDDDQLAINSRRLLQPSQLQLDVRPSTRYSLNFTRTVSSYM